MTMLTWLPQVLRDAGLAVEEVEGWKTRGHGEMGTPKGILCHHTAGPLTGDDPSLGVVIKGRPDLAGPLAQLFLGRDGTFHVVAAGRCYHAGAGMWHGVTQGNSQFIGIEAENAGTGKDHWPLPQMYAYITGVSAILRYLKQDDVWAVGHKEYALPKGRKTDPSFDMVEFREGVHLAMSGEVARLPQPASTDPQRAMLRKGDQGDSVKQLQSLLKVTADSFFGPKTEAAVKAFQKQHNLTVDGLVGPATWAALGVTNQTGVEKGE